MPTKKAAKRSTTPTRPLPAKKTATRKAATSAPAQKKAVVKKAVVRKPATPSKAPAAKAAATPAKATFGRPGTAGKAEGDAAVAAWMESVKAEHRPIVEKLDALIGETVPDVKRAIKWSMPMYGREGIGYFASVASFKNYVSLGFFSGTELTPPPPAGEGQGTRRVNIHDAGEYDEARFRAWIRQAASIKGWGKV